MLLQVSAQHFCAGVVVGQYAAPIVHYMRTWPLEKIERYCAHKGWRVEVVEGVNRTEGGTDPLVPLDNVSTGSRRGEA